MYWFTSDTHYNHTNILTKFIYRPFPNTECMNKELIKRHNERVKDGHTVYHLGDFKVSSDGPTVHELRQQLNGNHVFIQGKPLSLCLKSILCMGRLNLLMLLMR